MFSRILFIVVMFFSSQSFASWGLNVGVGFPFVTQAGVNYIASPDLTFYAAYNALNVDVGTAKVDLTLPEVGLLYHPFSGAFFVGLAIGQESLGVSSTDVTTGITARADVDALTAAARLGWMWGKSNGGFWAGVDASFINPMGADVSVTAPGLPTTAQEYRDVVEAAEKFGETAYFNITFLRIGYIF